MYGRWPGHRLPAVFSTSRRVAPRHATPRHRFDCRPSVTLGSCTCFGLHGRIRQVFASLANWTTNVQLPQNSFVKSPPYFAEGIIGMTPQNAENFVKIWRLVSEKFFEIKIILFWAPFTGGPDAKILILSSRRPPTAQKISSLPDLPFWRYEGSKFQLSHPFPQNWVARSPPYFA